MKKVVLGVIILCMAGAVFAKSGARIPIPKVSASEAIAIASDYFYSGKTKVIDAEYFKIEEYILILVEYTNNFGKKEQTEWAWKLKLVHPIANDHSVTYKVTNDKKIIELGITE